VATDGSSGAKELYVAWTERGTNKVKFALCQWDSHSNLRLEQDGFVFSHGKPDDITSPVGPRLRSGSFGLAAVWVGGGNHFFMSASDLSSPGLGGYWSDPVGFEDSSGEAPLVLPVTSTVRCIWLGGAWTELTTSISPRVQKCLGSNGQLPL
jgi:hypothetical protein